MGYKATSLCTSLLLMSFILSHLSLRFIYSDTDISECAFCHLGSRNIGWREWGYLFALFFKNKELEQNDLCLLTCDNVMG